MIRWSFCGNIGFLDADYIRNNLHCTCSPSYINNKRMNKKINLCGYIPVLGIFFGLGRIVFNVDESNYLLDKCIGIIRGICEMLGIGLVFLLLDLIVTAAIYIHCKLRHGMPKSVVQHV